MSVSGYFGGGVERTAPVALSTTTTTDIYTAYDQYSTVAAFSIANTSGGSVTVEAYYYDGTTDFLVWVKSVADDTAEKIEGLPLKLHSGDKFRVKGATGITVTPIVVRNHGYEQAANRAG